MCLQYFSFFFFNSFTKQHPQTKEMGSREMIQIKSVYQKIINIETQYGRWAETTTRISCREWEFLEGRTFWNCIWHSLWSNVSSCWSSNRHNQNKDASTEAVSARWNDPCGKTSLSFGGNSWILPWDYPSLDRIINIPVCAIRCIWICVWCT